MNSLKLIFLSLFSMLVTPVISQSHQVVSTDFVDGNSTFAFEMHRKVFSTEKNTFFSPYSVSSLLAMIYGGARGTTEQEIQKVFHFEGGQKKTHNSFNVFNKKLTQPSFRKIDSQLSIANAIWVKNFSAVKPSYLDLVKDKYNSGVFQMPNKADVINQWAAKQTHDKIKEIVTDENIGSSEMILTNAIYFKAAWENVFKEEATNKSQFKLANGKLINVDMMHQYQHFNFYDDKINMNKVIELPYMDGTVTMYIILPYGSNSIEKLSASIDTKLFNDYTKALFKDYSRYNGKCGVTLSMPKFEISAEYLLNTPLMEMGMPSAFNGSADFSGMMDGVKVDFISHKAVLTVNEKGAEAAAVSTGAMNRASVEEVECNLNSPFMVFICDQETGSILFMGSIVNPTK